MTCICKCVTGILHCIGSIFCRIFLRIRILYLICYLDYLKRDDRDLDTSFVAKHIFPPIAFLFWIIWCPFNFLKEVILMVMDTKRTWSIYKRRKRTPYLYFLFTESHPYNRVFYIALYLLAMIVWINFCYFIQRAYMPEAHALSMSNSALTLIFGGGLPVFLRHGRAYSKIFMPRMMVLTLKTLLVGTLTAHSKEMLWDNIYNNFDKLTDGLICGKKFLMEVLSKTTIGFDERTDEERKADKGESKDNENHSIVFHNTKGVLSYILSLCFKIKHFSESITNFLTNISNQITEWITKGIEWVKSLIPLNWLKKLADHGASLIQSAYSSLKYVLKILRKNISHLKDNVVKVLGLDFQANYEKNFTTTKKDEPFEYIGKANSEMKKKFPFFYLAFQLAVWMFNNSCYFSMWMIVLGMFMFIFQYRFLPCFANEYLTKEFDDYNERKVKDENRESIYPLTFVEAAIHTRYDRWKWSRTEALNAVWTLYLALFFAVSIGFTLTIDYAVWWLMKYINDGMKYLVQKLTQNVKTSYAVVEVFSTEANITNLVSEVDELFNRLEGCFNTGEFGWNRYIIPVLVIICIIICAFLEAYFFRIAVQTCDELFPERVQIRAHYLYHTIIFKRLYVGLLLKLLGVGVIFEVLDYVYKYIGGEENPVKETIFCFACHNDLTEAPAYDVVKCPRKLCEGINCIHCLKRSKGFCICCDYKLNIDKFFYCRTMLDFELQQLQQTEFPQSSTDLD